MSNCKYIKPFLTDIHKNVYEPLSSRLIQGADWILKNITNEYTFTETYSATCQQCQEFKAYFTIHGVGVRSKDGTNNFYLQKVGQFPELTIKPEPIFKSFLSDEDLKYYTKGAALINNNFGLGALTYWRRIVENEIINIAHKIANQNNDLKPIIDSAYNKFKIHHRMTNFLDDIKTYLPSSILLSGGENPLYILYKATSDAVHNLTEDECTERAKDVKEILKKVIQGLNQNDQDKDARQAADRLRKSMEKK